MTNSFKNLTPADRDFLSKIIQTYLSSRPFFYVFIRPQEALLFHVNRQLIKPPILDFGCGDGFFAYHVFGRRQIDVGLDIQDSRLAETSQFPAYKHTLVYDGQNIPFPANHFQTVISNCVFEHLPHLQKNLAEIYRVLKPGGYLLTTVMTDQWDKHLLGAKFFGESYRRYFRRKQQHLNLYSKNQWLGVHTDLGFRLHTHLGYEGQKVSRWNESSHFLSLPSLITYKFIHRWTLFPAWHQFFNLSQVIQPYLLADLDNQSPGALFLVFHKS